MLLPGSFILSDTPLITSLHPVSYEALADIHEGTVDGRPVRVKQIRGCHAFSSDDKWVGMVRCLPFPLPLSLSTVLQSFTRRLSCGGT